MDRKVLIVSGDWNKGVVGLVAGKIAEEYHKPAIVLSKEGEEATGSARTAGNFDVIESLKYASDHLVRFGGHQQAAGLTLKTEQFELFYQKILEYADKNLSVDDINPVLNLEAELGPGQLSLSVVEGLQSLEPFGVGNPRPKFLISAMTILSIRAVGATGQHLQLRLKKDNVEISSIAFNMGYLAQSLKIGDTIDVAAELIEDGWNGRREVKLRVIDLKNSNKL